MNKNILLIEKDKRLRSFWSEVLGDEGFGVAGVEPGEKILSRAKETLPDIVFIGTGFDSAEARNLLEELNKKNPNLLVISPANPGELAKELDAIEAQGVSYKEHPIRVDQVKAGIRDAIRLQEIKERYNFKNLIGKSPGMQEVFNAISSVIKSYTTTILITGETGTGKEEVAKAIHYNSDRAEKPFIALSCTAVPETLMESELFGYEQGAFTDARTMKKGMLEIADRGTVFLDEIGDMKPGLQSKLLRFLEEKEFRRIGGTKDISVDARIIAATNKNLEKMVEEEDFRKDLFYRLKVFPIHIPPLRERKDDIPLLAGYFISRFNAEFKKEVKGLTFSAREKITAYNWPGNVRELKNVIERAMILSRGDFIQASGLILEGTPKGMASPTPSKAREELSLKENEKRLIKIALERGNGNQGKAAESLGITRFALRNRLKKYNMC